MRQTIPPDITPIMVIISFSMFCCPEISVVDQVLHGGISVTATKKNEKKKNNTPNYYSNKYHTNNRQNCNEVGNFLKYTFNF